MERSFGMKERERSLPQLGQQGIVLSLGCGRAGIVRVIVEDIFD